MHFNLLVQHMFIESEQGMAHRILGCLFIMEDVDADYLSFEIFEVDYQWTEQ